MNQDEHDRELSKTLKAAKECAISMYGGRLYIEYDGMWRVAYACGGPFSQRRQYLYEALRDVLPIKDSRGPYTCPCCNGSGVMRGLA